LPPPRDRRHKRHHRCWPVCDASHSPEHFSVL